jgi:putative FmdB family regulatory protein
MPLYEYHCLACGVRFRKRIPLQLVASLPVCPQCASPQTERIFSHFARLHTDTELAENLTAKYAPLAESQDHKTAESLLHEMSHALGEDLREEE